MKKNYSIIIILIALLTLFSCKKDHTLNDKIEDYFYNLNDRIGYWINSDKGDTLNFLDSINLIRNYSFFSSPEHYNYRIIDKYLYIKLPNSDIETKHLIISLNGTEVTLGNMYITIGFEGNYGIFKKLIKK
jgi:hypothetical protein